MLLRVKKNKVIIFKKKKSDKCQQQQQKQKTLYDSSLIPHPSYQTTASQM